MSLKLVGDVDTVLSLIEAGSVSMCASVVQSVVITKAAEAK